MNDIEAWAILGKWSLICIIVGIACYTILEIARLFI